MDRLNIVTEQKDFYISLQNNDLKLENLKESYSINNFNKEIKIVENLQNSYIFEDKTGIWNKNRGTFILVLIIEI